LDFIPNPRHPLVLWMEAQVMAQQHQEWDGNNCFLLASDDFLSPPITCSEVVMNIGWKISSCSWMIFGYSWYARQIVSSYMSWNIRSWSIWRFLQTINCRVNTSYGLAQCLLLARSHAFFGSLSLHIRIILER
jgi:hypothetical protein